jgi:hypothetical protein
MDSNSNYTDPQPAPSHQRQLSSINNAPAAIQQYFYNSQLTFNDGNGGVSNIENSLLSGGLDQYLPPSGTQEYHSALKFLHE